MERGPVSNGFVNATFPFSYNNQPGASGPWPHTRYVPASKDTFTINVNTLQSTGSSIMAADQQSIINDDLVGGITVGGQVRAMCPFRH